MKNIELFDDLICIELYAEGYYSCAVEEHLMFVTKEYFEENEDELMAYVHTFSEIDGKHSSTEATTTWDKIHEENITEQLLIHMTSDFDQFEGMFGDDFKEIKALNEKIWKLYEVKTRTIHDIVIFSTEV